MNTLLRTLMLLSPNQATIDNEVKLQTAHAVNVIQLENQAHLKKQITLTLEKMEMTLPTRWMRILPGRRLILPPAS